LLLVLVVPSYAQNTKGDQPAKPTRETRFKAKPKKSKKQKAGKRISPRGKSQSTSAVRGPAEKPWRGDITGRKIPAARSRTNRATNDDSQSRSGNQPPGRVAPRSASGSVRNVYPQKGPYVRKTRPPKSDDSPLRFRSGAGQRQRVVSATGRTKNVFPQKGPYVAKTTPPSRGDSPRRFTGRSATTQRVRTATGQTKNVFPQRGPYVAKTRPPSTGDAPRKWTGRQTSRQTIRTATGKTKTVTTSRVRFRTATGSTRNVFSQKGPYVSSATLKPRTTENPPGKKKKRKVAYSASRPFIRNKSINPYAGFWNKKHKGEKAYLGDISGKKLRTRNFETPPQPPGEATVHPYLKRKRVGDVSYSGKAAGAHVSATRPGAAWQGDISGRKLRRRNYSSKDKAEAVGQPMIKAPLPGKEVGGLVGKFNIKQTTGFSRQGVDFSGHMKARKPMKGGGSISGKLWNNNERPLTGRAPKGSAMLAGTYQGNLKARKPMKGGGSISGQLWNNNEQPIQGRAPKGSAYAMGNYRGSMKVSMKEPGKEVGGFPGKYRMFDLHPSMRKQGEDFTGHIKRPLLNRDYMRNPYAVKESLLKSRPTKRTFELNGLLTRIKQQDYRKKPNAADGSMPGIAPGQSSVKASEYARGSKQDWRYIHNPSSADEAMKVKDHGKALARLTDYQGNIKMKKASREDRRNLHPDAKFVQTNKNNVKEEKGLMTNFKLLWARWFKKSDTQPNHLKEKIQKPRYDKGEIGLWYK
jgi:hypothetical protein